MNDFDEMPTMNVIHLLALKDNKIRDLKKALTVVRNSLEPKKNDDRTSWSLWKLSNEALKGNQ